MSPLHCHQLDVGIADVMVVRSLTLSLNPGELWGLLGPNGIGKTTLLKCLAGLIEPDRGDVILGDQILSDMARRNIALRLGMLQQHTLYLFDANVLQIALTGRHPHLRRWDRESSRDFERAKSALSSVGLEGFSERGVTTLSGGEARRLAFATLLVQEPEVMLLDEPTNHLDMRHQVQIMDIAARLVVDENRAALAALHDVNLASSYCSHVLLLFGDGEWKAGTVDEVLTRANLEQLYGCAVETIQTQSGHRFHPVSPGSSSAC